MRTRHTAEPIGRLQSLLAFALAVALALVAPSMAGCSDDSGGAQSCEVNTDCPIPESCVESKCRLQCRRDADCAQGQTCDPEDFVCEGGGERCDSRTNPCAFGQVCALDGVCVGALDDGGPTPPRLDSGLTLLDASAGPLDDARIAPPPDADHGPGHGDDARVVPPRDAGPPPPDMAERPRGHAPYGERCVCPSDCESGFCVENKMRGARTCTERCERDAECPGIDTCLMAEVHAGGAGAECPPFDNGLDPGQIVGVCYPNETSFPCTDPLECTSGICLGLASPVAWADPHDVCTVRCDGNDKCPAGYNCQSIPNGNGNSNVCAPSLAGIAACVTYQECGGVCPLGPGVDEASVAACLPQVEGGPGYCTCTCAHASDCPQGYACQRALNSGDPARPGICTPLAGHICPVEALGVPPVPLECLSYQCLGGDDATPFYSRCTSTCVDDRDCPQNYRCDAIDDGQAGPDPHACVPH